MFSTLLRDLRSHAINNIEFYQNGTTRTASLFYKSFSLLHEHLDRGIQPTVEEIMPRLSEYDLSPDIQANGYRSLVKVVHKCCLHLLQLSRHVSNHRTSMFFRGHHYSKELEAYVSVLGQLRAGLHYAQKLMPFCDQGSLFANEEYLDNDFAENILKEVECLSQDCFYGRSLGFQFCESMVKPLQGVGTAMASFSESFSKNGSHLYHLTSSVLNFGKYMLDPDLRAQKVVDVTRTADISFCKSFWSITESDFMQLSHLACPQLHVNEVITLNPGPFEMNCHNSVESVVITPPCAHTGPAEIKLRLLSNHWRSGQKVAKTKMNGKPHPMSPGLVLHCHGGGFVAQSSRSHEVYLRQWAKTLDVPILSIDYSLAPDFPFPRALEECFYAYAWALQNSEELGWTGEKICFAGDSAGGNLMVATAIRAASFQIRVPDGIMAAYTPFLVRYTPSPSRLMGLMDPLLPVGILTRCLAAYAGVSTSFSPKDDKWVVVEYKKSAYPPPPDCVDSGKGSNSDDPESRQDGDSTMDALTSSSEPENQTEDDSLFEDVSIENNKEPSFENITIDKDEVKSDDEFEVVSGNGDSNASLFTLEDYDPESDKQGVCDSKVKEGDPTGRNEVHDTNVKDSGPMDLESSEDLASDLDPLVLSNELNNEDNAKESAVIDTVDASATGTVKSAQSLSVNSSHDFASNKHKKLSRVSKGLSQHTSMDLPPQMCQSVNSDSSPSNVMKKQMSMSCISDRSSTVSTDFSFFQTGVGALNFEPLKAAKHHIEHSPLTAFRHLPIVKNPYMSPLLASDELLKGLPPVYLVACHLDPLLDDSVMFAKKLRDLKNPVDLHLIDDLPHGFLNFSLVSKEARLASDICISKIMAVLG